MQTASITAYWVIAMLAAEAGGADAVNYGRPFEPPTRPAFIALPPGAVEPGGWLRDWCLAARDGYTGHMDEVHQEFQRAWAADHTMTGDRLTWPKGAWPYEGGGYWFDGLVRLGYVLHDDALIQQAKKRLDVVVTHMNPDSILFLWWLNKNRPEDLKSIECDCGVAHVGLRPPGTLAGRLLRRLRRQTRIADVGDGLRRRRQLGPAGMGHVEPLAGV